MDFDLVHRWALHWSVTSGVLVQPRWCGAARPVSFYHHVTGTGAPGTREQSRPPQVRLAAFGANPFADTTLCAGQITVTDDRLFGRGAIVR